jgi:Ca2+-binding EF-hand superfamily protein
MTRLDLNKDGFISREDYELMGKKLTEHSGVTEEQVKATKTEIMKVADAFNLKPGVKIPLEEAAKKASETILSMSPTERKDSITVSHNLLFDAIDTNKDGHISVKELEVYFNIIAPGISQAEIIHSFNTIDTDKNEEISREEFMTAAEDFLHGVEETELSKVFFGHLLD